MFRILASLMLSALIALAGVTGVGLNKDNNLEQYTYEQNEESSEIGLGVDGQYNGYSFFYRSNSDVIENGQVNIEDADKQPEDNILEDYQAGIENNDDTVEPSTGLVADSVNQESSNVIVVIPVANDETDQVEQHTNEDSVQPTPKPVPQAPGVVQKSPEPTPQQTSSPTPQQTSSPTPQQTSSPTPQQTPQIAPQVVPKQLTFEILDDEIFYTIHINKGLLGVRYSNTSGKKIKLIIEKDSVRYNYDIKGDNTIETFSLQMGSGEYRIRLLENTEGSKYKSILTETINVSISNQNDVYLNSVQMINWNYNMAAIKKAKEITAGITDESEKIKRIYEFVVQSIKYDYNKLSSLPSSYLPVIDDTLRTKSGICYDSASLTAAMLRSVGIPTKLVMGYAEGVNGYHAWNEVYNSSTGKWITMDTSVDSQLKEANASYSMVKISNKYQSTKEY